MEDELELALGEPRFRVADRLPGALVPEHHRAAAILALGNGAFEIAIVERVVLDMHRQALVLRVVARPARHCPADEDAVQLEAEIVMEPRRRVLLDEIAIAAGLAGALRPARLGGLGEIALGAVGGKRVGWHGFSRLSNGTTPNSVNPSQGHEPQRFGRKGLPYPPSGWLGARRRHTQVLRRGPSLEPSGEHRTMRDKELPWRGAWFEARANARAPHHEGSWRLR